MRNQLIDIIRFIAAIAVALFHFNCYNNPISPTWYSESVKFGWLAVPAFFVISGYCIALAAENSKQWNDFIIKRFFRIYPPYLVSWIFTFIIIVIAKYIRGFNRLYIPHSIVEILQNIFLLTHPFSKTEPMNPVYWSLTVEIFFYMVVAAMKSIGNKYILVVSLIVSSLGLMPIHFSGVFFFMNDWPAFAIGIGCYYFLKESYLFKLIAVLLTVVSIISMYFSHHLGDTRMFYLLVTVATALITLFGAYWKKDVSKLSWLGDFSFGIYIIHFPLGVTLLGILKSDTIFNSPFFTLFFDFLTLGLTIIIARLFFKYIEIPSIVYGKKVAQYFQ